MRYAIWAAVSTAEQAKSDKTSLTEQENRCRKVADTKGWKETAGPYVVPGESRTQFVNLRDAEMEIPALHALLEDAQQGKFDILLLYDYNRLRDLLDPVAKTLASYGIQIYSVNQPVEPIIPEDFNLYASDSASMMQGMAQIISRWQIADLKRKYRYGVMARVQRGLPSTGKRWGYEKQNGSPVPVPVPEQAAIIIEIKDMYLAGVPLREMVRVLDKKYPTPTGVPKWTRPTVTQILFNPFYAGKVFFGRWKVQRDPHANITKTVKNDNPILIDGQHEALYTWEDYQAILIEKERRAGLPTSMQYPFSGLLRCSVCGKRLVHHDGDRWRCKYPRGSESNHISLPNAEALEIIPPAIQKAVLDAQTMPDTDILAPQPTQHRETARVELEKKRKKVQQGYEDGIFTAAEAQDRIKAIEAEIAALQDKDRERIRHMVERKRLREVLEDFDEHIGKIPQWIREENPRTVNEILHILCREIIVSPDRKITVHLRGQ